MHGILRGATERVTIYPYMMVVTILQEGTSCLPNVQLCVGFGLKVMGFSGK